MIDNDTFANIRREHGGYASWAVWAEPTSGPKSNVGDLSLLDPERNPDLLSTLRSDVVMLGLNLARSEPERPFANFHDPSPRAQDYRIRYAFSGTPYYGAYMTDLVKDYIALDSKAVVRDVTRQPQLLGANIARLLGELDDLRSESPTLIAFGRDTYRLALNNLPRTRFKRIVGVTHYSHYISKEAYREQVLGVLAS